MTNVLRRRGELAPLQRSLGEDGLDDDEDPFEVYILVTPCSVRVSNDPINESDELEEDPCNITRFECPPALPGGTTKDVVVPFDYEMHYDDAGNWNETVRALESNVLQHLALLTGLMNCRTAVSLRDDPVRSLNGFSEYELGRIIALDVAPDDEADPVFDECIIPVRPSDVRGTVCQPMKGYFTATLKEDEEGSSAVEGSIRSNLLRAVRQGMNDGTYEHGNIKKLSFIGDRSARGADPLTSNPSGDDGGVSGAGIAFIVLGCLALLLLLGLFVVRRRNRDDSQHVIFEDPESDLEAEQAELQPTIPTEDPASMSAKDTLALKPEPMSIQTGVIAGVSTTPEPIIGEIDGGDWVAAIPPPASAAPTASAEGGSPSRSLQRKKKRKSKPKSPVDDTIQTLDSIAEIPDEDELPKQSGEVDAPMDLPGFA